MGVDSQDFLELSPCHPTGLVSAPLCSPQLIFHIAVEFLHSFHQHPIKLLCFLLVLKLYIKLDCCHSLLISVHAEPPVALLGPRFCPHPPDVGSSQPKIVGKGKATTIALSNLVNWKVPTTQWKGCAMKELYSNGFASSIQQFIFSVLRPTRTAISGNGEAIFLVHVKMATLMRTFRVWTCPTSVSSPSAARPPLSTSAGTTRSAASADRQNPLVTEGNHDEQRIQAKTYGLRPGHASVSCRHDDRCVSQ